MSENTGAPSASTAITFDIQIEISPGDLELIDKAAAAEGIDRLGYLRRAAKIGVLDARRTAAVALMFDEPDNAASDEP